MFCTAPALVVCAADVDDPVPGENGPQRRGADRDDTDIQFQRKARALPSRDSYGKARGESARIRIETPDGVFLIYDVAIPATEPREKGGYAAYWGDKLEATLYQYDRLLLDSIDVGHALVNLSRDLLIDVSALAASDPWLEEAFFDALEDAADPTVWIRPVQSAIARPKGFIPATDASDGGVLKGQRGGPTNDPCPVAQNSICISDFDGNQTCSCVLAPVRCLGACCTLDCDDGNVCTTEGCAFGACFHAPNTLPCADDDDPCTKDVCAGKLCTHPDKDCSDEFELDACTEEEDIYCEEGVGCVRDWFCGDGDPCTYDSCCLDGNGLYSAELCPSDQGQANCYHDPMWPFHDVAVLCPNVSGCIGIITVVGHDYVALNNDDDNRNNILDYLEPGEVAGENDLVPVDLNFASCMGNCEEEPPADGWQLHLLFSPGVQLYFDPVRLSEVNTLGGAYPYPAPSRVFMEGRQLSTECGGPIVGANTKAFTPGDGVNICCFAESLPVRVVKVTSLEWEPYRVFDINNVDLETCPINGGRRIFTGKIDPSDTHPTQRKYVTLVATVDPPIEGVQVYFKVWDVDDPFDQLYGPLHRDGVEEVPGVSTLDPGTDDRYGIDNRGGSGGLTGTAVTDSDGKARKTFHTSRQPGDNYRAAATCLKQLLDNNAPNPQQVYQATADALSVKIEAGKYVPNGGDSGYKLPVVWSKMLTVWRKLHVELDSMGAGMDPTGVVNRNLDQTGVESGHSNHSWAEINDWSGEVQNGQLEGGTLTVTGGGTYEIVDNLDDAGDDSIFVNGSILADEDKPANAVDDDAPFVPRKADISLVNEKYKFAYVEIEEHSDESQLSIPFVVNLSEDVDVVVPATAPGRSPDFLTSPNYWTAQVVTCFQGPKTKDHDPDGVYHFVSPGDQKLGDPALYGQTPPPNPGFYDNISMVFLETIRDYAAWTVFFSNPIFANPAILVNPVDAERVTVAHELGHMFGIPFNPHPPAGLMKEGADDADLEFRGQELDIIRSSTVIGQP